MNSQRSTFDQLVDTLSSEDAQYMLENIADSMKESASIQFDNDKSQPLLNASREIAVQLQDEPFLFRLWLCIKAFFKSVEIVSVYEDELVKRIGKNLQRNYRQYINVKKGLFLTDFYVLLHDLRKTQMFFSALLSSYDSDKGNFYLLVSSFVIPITYNKLLTETDPFLSGKKDENPAYLRADFLKRIDECFSLIDSDHKANMYLCAQAIEWIKNFCELPIDKVLLRFTVNSQTDAVCPIQFMGSGLSGLAGSIMSVQPIPDSVLQALFLLSQQDRIHDNSFNLTEESESFITEAADALGAIKRFSGAIPIYEFARFAEHTTSWEAPSGSNGGEDWFLLFKSAWKKRFNDKWIQWTAEQKRLVLERDILAIFKQESLKTLAYRPWLNVWLPLRFKRDFVFKCLNSFFSSFYTEHLYPILQTIQTEGNFYRRENQAEYAKAFIALEKHKEYVEDFERHLSPEGKTGSAFLDYKEHDIHNIKMKANMEILMKSIEADAKQIVISFIKTLQVLITLLNGFVGGNKSSIYAPLVNWHVIKGPENAQFREQVELILEEFQKLVVIIGDAELLDTDF